jgi:hypothetical protein
VLRHDLVSPHDVQVKRTIVGVVLVAIAIAIVIYLRRDHGETPAAPASTVGSSAPVTSAPGSATAPPAKPDHVRRLSAADRKLLGAEIAAARAKALASSPSSSGSSGPAPKLPDDSIPLESVGADLRKAMEEAIPILAACYEQHYGSAAMSGRTAVAQMQMTSDPELGTVIDTPTMTDEDGAKLDPKLDDCLRETIETLALPPFKVGGVLRMQYSFRFD